MSRYNIVFISIVVVASLCLLLVLALNFGVLHSASRSPQQQQQRRLRPLFGIEPGAPHASRKLRVSNDNVEQVSSSSSVSSRPQSFLPQLDIDAPASAAAVAAAHCPLPLLHAEKFAPMMKWGIRKKFDSCEFKHHPGGNFSRIERRRRRRRDSKNENKNDDDSESDNEFDLFVMVDSSRCHSQLSVYEFDEMADSDFRRMTSTYDAEARQNALRDKYKHVNQFAVEVKRHAGGERRRSALGGEQQQVVVEEFKLTKPYAVVECDQDMALHITAPRSIPVSSSRNERNENGNFVGNNFQQQRFQQQQQQQQRFQQNEQHKQEQHNHHGNQQRKQQRQRRRTFKNILHMMWDSTSIYAFRRGAKQTKQFLQSLHNNISSPSHVFGFKHLHSVSCCSPGNQIPFYSGVMNGEGDFFVRSEPQQDSTDWLWNIARDELGYKTFWSLDNCPDKSARDYHAFPSVDSRVVAPLCLAGVLLSHKERACLGGKSVDEQVLDGLADFWRQNKDVPKFAAVQFISPHEETEKQLIELDALVARWFREQVVFDEEELRNTLIVLWSDHGINFGKYAATSDGEIEKMFPFAFFIVPKSQQHDGDDANDQKSENQQDTNNYTEILNSLQSYSDELVTPYDMFETVRSLMYLPERAPPMRHDPRNPPLPRPEDSHIMASFQKEIVPVDMTKRRFTSSTSFSSSLLQKSGNENENDHHHHIRKSCEEANIPIEFCSCLPWLRVDVSSSSPSSPSSILTPNSLFRDIVTKILIKEHNRLLFPQFSDRCDAVVFAEMIGVHAQVWPFQYKPKAKQTAKRMWMKPNKDFVKIKYRTAKNDAIFVGVVAIVQGLLTRREEGGVGGETAAVVGLADNNQLVRILSAVKNSAASNKSIVLDIIRLDRVDAMKKKCGIVQKVPEQLCVCK